MSPSRWTLLCQEAPKLHSAGCWSEDQPSSLQLPAFSCTCWAVEAGTSRIMSSRHGGVLYSLWETEKPMDTNLPMGALQLYPRNFCP